MVLVLKQLLKLVFGQFKFNQVLVAAHITDCFMVPEVPNSYISRMIYFEFNLQFQVAIVFFFLRYCISQALCSAVQIFNAFYYIVEVYSLLHLLHYHRALVTGLLRRNFTTTFLEQTVI